MKNLLIAIACFAIGFLALMLIESCFDPLPQRGIDTVQCKWTATRTAHATWTASVTPAAGNGGRTS